MLASCVDLAFLKPSKELPCKKIKERKYSTIKQPSMLSPRPFSKRAEVVLPAKPTEQLYIYAGSTSHRQMPGELKQQKVLPDR